MIDWVLRMARVPAGRFPRCSRGGTAGSTPELLDALGDAVAAFHCSLPPETEIDAVAAMRHVAEGNAQSALDAGLPGAAVRAWQTQQLVALDTHCAVAGTARTRWLRSPRAWRSASWKSMPLAGEAGSVRRAGIRRGDGDDRPGLRPCVPADGSRSARRRGRRRTVC